MAVNKATLAANFASNTPNDPRVHQSRSRVVKQSVAIAATDNDGDVFLVAPVHSSWCIDSIAVLNDAITGGTDYDVGLYEIAETVVDADAYASGVDMSSARTAPLDVAFEARDVANVQNAVWQDAGPSADPQKWFYLALTANTAGTAAGDIAVIIRYTSD